MDITIIDGEVATGTVGDPLAGDTVVLAIPYDAIDDVSRWARASAARSS